MRPHDHKCQLASSYLATLAQTCSSVPEPDRSQEGTLPRNRKFGFFLYKIQQLVLAIDCCIFQDICISGLSVKTHIGGILGLMPTQLHFNSANYVAALYQAWM